MNDATLLSKVESSIASNHSLQMLKVVCIAHSIVEVILKGACRNISLKELDIQVVSPHDRAHLKAAADELWQVRPQMNFHLHI